MNRYTLSTNKSSRVHDPRMTPDVLSTPLPHEFRFIGDGDVAHDEMLSHHANASTKGYQEEGGWYSISYSKSYHRLQD